METGSVKAEGPDGEGGVEGDGGEDSAELHSMQAHLNRLSHSLSDMHQELRSARAYEMGVLEQLVERVDRKFKRAPPAVPATPAQSEVTPVTAVEVA